MKLIDYDFPDLKDADIAFSTLRVDPNMLDEAKEQGFYKGHTPYNDLFSELFFKGGKLNFKKDLDSEFKEKAFRYLQALMHSFEPRHEEKEAVCAFILSELVEVES